MNYGNNFGDGGYSSQQYGYGQQNPQGNYNPQDRYQPQGGYGPPMGPPQGFSQGGYGPPQQNFGPPQQNFGPPQGCGQPQEQYGAQYGAPQQGYDNRQAHGYGGQGGRKKAVICGCNYPGSDCQLGGCINDAHCMAYLLTNKFGFSKENMRILLDDSADRGLHPTRANILDGWNWLLSDCQPGDSLVFHYSGHGSQERDQFGEEKDGMNETLCPTDFKQAGMIVDNELNQRLINPLPHGVRLHIIIDACHSGSVCDLEYCASVKGGQPSWKNEYQVKPQMYKGTAGGLAVQFGAATDDQTAADTNKLSGNVSTGAATFSFIQAIERVGTHISYGTVLHEMHKSLKSMNAGSSGGGGMAGGLGSMFGGSASSGGTMGKLVSVGMSMLTRGGGDLGGLLGSLASSSNSGGWKKQTPVLSSNEAFDFNTPLQL